MLENIRRFTQANHTPSLHKDQIDLLGWTANTDVAQLILEGKDIPDTIPLDDNIRLLAPFLSTPPSISALGPISSTVSRDEFRWYWKRCKEQTSCGISSLHFGHFKASCMSDELTDIDRMFLQLNLQYGVVLDRWLQAIDVMIPKKSTSIRVDKLRTIMLFEADWNFANKLIGKRTMQQSEAANTIAPEQYGSRKRKSAILHATNKQLVFDLVRQRKINVVLLVLDATSCYDRISIPIASLCLQRQGVSQSQIKVMFVTLDQMVHYIRTSFGDSITFYTNHSDERFHVIGQGARQWSRSDDMGQCEHSTS
jgi:hypothetical protein